MNGPRIRIVEVLRPLQRPRWRFPGGHRRGPPGERRWEDGHRGYRRTARCRGRHIDHQHPGWTPQDTPPRRPPRHHQHGHHLHQNIPSLHHHHHHHSSQRYTPFSCTVRKAKPGEQRHSASGMQIPLGGKLGSRPIPVIERRSTTRHERREGGEKEGGGGLATPHLGPAGGTGNHQQGNWIRSRTSRSPAY